MEEMDSNACVYSTNVKRLFVDDIMTGWLRRTQNNLQTVFFMASSIFIWIIWMPRSCLRFIWNVRYVMLSKHLLLWADKPKLKMINLLERATSTSVNVNINSGACHPISTLKTHIGLPWTGSCCMICRWWWWWQCCLSDKRKWKRGDDDCRNIYLPAHSHLDHLQNDFWERVLRLW